MHPVNTCDCGRPTSRKMQSYKICSHCAELQLEYRETQKRNRVSGVREERQNSAMRLFYNKERDEAPICGGSLLILRQWLGRIGV